MLAVTAIVASLTVPLLRYLMPVRLVAEAAGLIALWGLIWRLPSGVGAAGRAPRVVHSTRRSGARLGRLADGARTPRGAAHRARSRRADGASARGTRRRDRPDPATWRAVDEQPRTLARVGHAPADHPSRAHAGRRRRVPAPRRLPPRRHRVPRSRARVDRMDGGGAPSREAPHNREWNIATARSYATDDGFTVVWFGARACCPRRSLPTRRRADQERIALTSRAARSSAAEAVARPGSARCSAGTRSRTDGARDRSAHEPRGPRQVGHRDHRRFVERRGARVAHDDVAGERSRLVDGVRSRVCDRSRAAGSQRVGKRGSDETEAEQSACPESRVS